MPARVRAFRPVFVLVIALAAGGAGAQDTLGVFAPEPEPPPFGAGRGVTVLLTNNGFGLGGLLRYRLDGGLTLSLEARLGSGRDEREEALLGGVGATTIRFKRNYFAQLPLLMGVEQRLFAEAIEDTVRPFAHAAVGPALGWQWPYFRDDNDNGILNDGEEILGYFEGVPDGAFRGGVASTLGVGAYFGRGRSSPGVRVGYAATYYFRPVELLELDAAVEGPSRQWFATPFVSVSFMRRF